MNEGGNEKEMKRVRGNKVSVVFDHIRFLGSGGNERGGRE